MTTFEEEFFKAKQKNWYLTRIQTLEKTIERLYLVGSIHISEQQGKKGAISHELFGSLFPPLNSNLAEFLKAADREELGELQQASREYIGRIIAFKQAQLRQLKEDFMQV